MPMSFPRRIAVSAPVVALAAVSPLHAQVTTFRAQAISDQTELRQWLDRVHALRDGLIQASEVLKDATSRPGGSPPGT